MKIAACLLLLWSTGLLRGQRPAMTVATIGDSFADALYLAMKVRPDLLKKHEINLSRWSRANIGFTRLDFFDYPGWLRDTESLGMADLCVVQLGSNDQQSIHTGKYQWAFFGNPQWKELYAKRMSDMLATMQEKRCKVVAWVLQPAFERSPALARGKIPVNDVQVRVLAASAALALDVVTKTDDYQQDGIHYGRDLMLRMGPALMEFAEGARDAIDGKCAACHNAAFVDQVYRPRTVAPLKFRERTP